jgi:hypothetical protein
MSALGVPVLINPDRAYWLSSIASDVIHSTIQVQELDANVGRFSTLFADQAEFSSFNVSTLAARDFDVSGMYVSSIRGNTAFFSTMTLASDLSGGVGFVRFSVDASGIQVDGDPIRFDNLVYLTSTINIIQVSTLVDTDIFAANGFFSTLSTGSLSSGLASIQQANISSLYVSSLEGFDISGAEPKEWSLYPTLNSSIIFQPGNVLSNDGNKLFYNGFELTDASGGGIDWSLYKAQSTVDMSSNRLINLSTIIFQDGGTLTSLTGNNLQYNGLPIQVGNASNVTQWASYPAVSSVNMSNFSISNASLVSASNLALTGSNVTNGNTFTGTLAVAGTTLIPLASINNLGQLSCQDIDVGSSAIGLADVNIYGATALPGDNALYVEGGVTCAGGTIHGFTAGVLPVAGINTGRIDMVQAGFNLLHPLVGAITTGAAMSLTAGGAMSMAAGGYVEMNTSTLQMINTSQGNKNTTIQAGFLTIDPDVAPTSSIKLFNTLGGGVEIDGGGQGSLRGFSTVQAANLSTLNLNVSTIDGIALSSITIPSVLDVSAVNIQGNLSVGQSTITSVFVANTRATADQLLWNLGLGVSTVSADYFGQRLWVSDSIIATTNLPPIDARIIGFSTIQGGQLSCINLQCSTINGAPPGGGGGGSINSFSTLLTSSFQVSSISGVPGAPINLTSFLKFVTPNAIDNVDVINLNSEQPPQLLIQASTISIGGNNVLMNSVSSVRHQIQAAKISTLDVSGTFTGPSIITSNIQTSTLQSYGGLPVRFESGIQFIPKLYLDNVEAINLTPDSIPLLQIGASTIQMNTNNVKTGSFSTSLISTGKGWIGDLSGTNALFSTISTNQFALSTIQMSEQSGVYSSINSSIMNVGYGYNVSTGRAGFWLENYINSTDNLEFGLVGNADGASITSWTNSRSSLSELFIDANTLTIGVDATVIVSQNGGGDFSLISPTLVATQYISTLSSINDFNPTPAFTNNLMLSTMELFAASTTLMYWDATTTSSNINTTAYDTVVGLNGTYKIGCSFQFVSGGSTDEVEFFLLKNDNVIVRSGGIIELENNQELVTYVESVETLVNGDKIQIGCYTANNNVFVSTINGAIIQSPAAILTMYKVG